MTKIRPPKRFRPTYWSDYFLNSWILRIGAFTIIALIAASANTDTGESTMMFSDNVAFANN